MESHRDKDGASQETSPRFLGVKSVIGVKKNGPLVPGNRQFATLKVIFGPNSDQHQRIKKQNG
jgi:hypothetical protein